MPEPVIRTDKIREVFLAFREQCIWLQCCYNTYCQFFESDDETTNLLETTAHLFFHDLNNILIEYILLQVCKITDPAESFGRANLTVETINADLHEQGLMTDEIDANASGLLRYRELIKEARNRVISHLDRNTVLAGLEIGEHSRQEVERFFECLYGYVDAVGTVLGVGPLDFKVTSGKGDALDLIKALKHRGA